MTRVKGVRCAHADAVVNPCGGDKPVKLRTPSGSIFSPGYDKWTYPNDAYCRWLIQAPPGKARFTAVY